jgi:hypothetical protein
MLISSAVYANTITIDEIRKLITIRMDAFQTYAKNNGYSYRDKITTPYQMYSYEKSDDKKSQTLEKFIYPEGDGSDSVIYSTTEKKEFLEFKLTIQKTGYKQVGEGKVPGVRSTYKEYKKNNESIRLIEPIISDDQVRPTYSIVTW